MTITGSAHHLALRPGDPAPDFDLPDVLGGGDVSRDRFAGRPLLVVFACAHCPYVRHVQEQLGQLGNDYLDSDLAIVAICSNDASRYPQDGPDGMRRQAAESGWRFPYLRDESQQVARDYGAACTPDPFLFDEHHQLAWRGRIDGTRPGNGSPSDGSELRAAIDAVIAGDEVPEHHPSLGCSIKWVDAG